MQKETPMDDIPVIYRHKMQKTVDEALEDDEQDGTPVIYRHRPQNQVVDVPQKETPVMQQKTPAKAKAENSYDFRATKEAVLIKTDLGNITLGKVRLSGLKWAAGYMQNGKASCFSEDTVDYCVLTAKKGLSRLSTAIIHTGAGHIAGTAITAAVNKDGFELGKTYYVEIYLRNGKSIFVKCSDNYFKMLKRQCEICKEKAPSRESGNNENIQYCCNCGTKIKKTANYCHNCGSKIE